MIFSDADGIKDYLNEYSKLKKILDSYNDEIKHCRYLIEKKYVGFISKYAKRKLTKYIDRLTFEKRQIQVQLQEREKLIDMLPECPEKQVLQLRYIQCRTIPKTADLMAYSSRQISRLQYAGIKQLFSALNQL